MKVYNNLNINKKHQGGIIAIGNFDGIHLGHKKVINQAKQKLDQAKIIYEKAVIEMLSDDQKIKYEAFKSESKNNN